MERSSPANLEIRLVRTKTDLAKVLDIRSVVFAHEQKIARSLDFDGLDDHPNTKQLLLFCDSVRSIGCARIRFLNSGKTAKLERVAVLEAYRGRGLGKLITKYAISYCKRMKVREIVIHAQSYLEKFYGSFGFKRHGEPFIEVGIPHVEMRIRV